MRFISEQQFTKRLITDAKTGTTTSADLAAQAVIADTDGSREIHTTEGYLTTVDGTSVPTSTPALATCRSCNQGPYTPDAVMRCHCGNICCRNCSRHHSGIWRCKRCHRYHLIKHFLQWITSTT